jgi:D-3-phosphoglycerate dehydrogenase
MKIRFECPLNFFSEEELSNFIKTNEITRDDNDPEVIIVNPGTPHFLDHNHFNRFKNLKVVATPSTGTNHIDVDYLRSKGIKTFCLLDDRSVLENIHASAEFTWLHIMNLVRKFSLAIKHVDEWREDSNEIFLRSNELNGKKIGIIGLGRIGKKIANYAKAFGMDIQFYDPYVDSDDFIKIQNIRDLSNCDIISINCYLTSETKELITYGTLDDVKKGTVIVNTSRGEVVNEDYILHLVNNKGVVFGADVLQNEQNIDQLKFSKLLVASKTNDNIVITPHVAGATVESQFKALNSVVSLSRRFLA